MADQYFHQKLVNMGFELYDEIIDYSFDSEPDMLKRAEAIAVNVKRISEQNTTELYQRIKAKAERNYNNYMRIFKDINTIPEIIKDRIYAINNGLVTKQNATDGRYVHMCHLMVNRHKIIHFDIWDSQLVEKINNFINDRGRISKIIFNSAIEFEYNKAAGSITLFNELVEFAKLYNIEFHLITGINKHNTISISDYVKIYYWPTFWLTMALSRLLVSPNYQMNNSICLDVEDVHVSRNIPIKYPFISMNKAPKIHRAIMMDMLAKHDVIDKGVVIWRETTESYPFKYWNQEIMLRDQLDRFVSQERLPLEYAMSFMQLVPETSEILFGLSEKTAMPLFFNKPFLVAGCMGFHKQLQELGFKLYDELFDYTFDSEPDIDIRYDLIAQNINRYTDKTPGQLKELYNSVFEKCVYNKKIALKLATQSSLIPTVWQDLVNHVVINKYPDYSDDINNFIRNNEHRFKEI
jgi:hypothetical protein